ncbi:class F sortase [Amycolatopsis palatopharyngis]|uniref:class F sortase n=1 Tax=Amycolatopsis palatopharyngis TaxID=187982 RepID=UPI000E25F583|nr:class F sortase [Amycolatopsis palatopharyngis]
MSRLSTLLDGRRRRLLVSAATAVLALGGIGAVTVGLTSQNSAPAPAAASGGDQIPGAIAPRPSDRTEPAPTTKAQPDAPTLPAAPPTAISIPTIGVQSSMITLGQNPDGTMEVPQPGPDYDKTGWYKHSPTPGELGPSVIAGHVDSAEKGPSVFFRLGAMQAGDQVSVTRADGTVAEFTVDRVEQYEKDQFPTLDVYGNTDTAQLRLITCGGEFDDQTDNYLDNIVVYAHFTGSDKT